MNLSTKRTSFGEYLLVFGLGALIYSLLEVLWRGYSHWTMALTGGFCLAVIYLLCRRMRGRALWQKCLVGSGIITATEFFVGCLVNGLLGWDVWDYSGLPGNLLGQVCFLYTGLWFILSGPAFWLCGLVQKKWFS